MNPSYQLLIDVRLSKPIEADSIWLRFVTRIPFVPRAGDKIRIPHMTDEDDTLDITFVNITYDVAGGMFLEEQEDDEMVENYAREGLVHEAAALAKYTPYGFHRLNFPQGVAR